MYFEDWVAQALGGGFGRGVDVDGAYGYQCWDLTAHYAANVCGSTTYPYLRTYTGSAKDVYRYFGAMNSDYFTRIANESGNTDQLPQAGDIIVYDGNDGHIEVVLGANSEGVDVIFQWGSTPAVGIQRTFRPWGDLRCLGWLRPKASIFRPVQLAPHERRVINDGVPANGRTGPGKNFPVVQTLLPGEVGEFKGFEHGQSIAGRTEWLIGKFAGNRFHISVFEDQSTHDLPDLTPTPQNPDPKPEPEPVEPYTFDADISSVTEVIPAHPSNFQRGQFPATPTTAVLHDFGTKGLNTLQSVLNYFTTDHTNAEDSQVSAHFVISRGRRIQMVSLADRAWHAGPKGNDFIGIEIDPIVGSDDPADATAKEETIASVRLVLTELRDRYGVRLDNIKHSSLMATSCGDDIDLRRYVVGEFEPDEPIPHEPSEEEPEPEIPTPGPEPEAPSQQPPWWVIGIGIAVTAIIGFLSAVFGG